LDSTKHNSEEYDADTVIYERSPQYERALEEMGTYVTIGRNVHDDAVDSISQIAERVFDTLQRRTVIMDCPF
jgi:phage terminase large subunit-like protein